MVHQVAKLHHRLGKPVPPTYQVIAAVTSSSQDSTPKTVTVTATPPRINFVGGKKLSMSGKDDGDSGIKVYPPTPTGTTGSTPSEQNIINNTIFESCANIFLSSATTTGESEVEPVGML